MSDPKWSPPETTQATLWCALDGFPAEHTYVKTTKEKDGTGHCLVRWFRCEACLNHRAWGRETIEWDDQPGTASRQGWTVLKGGLH